MSPTLVVLLALVLALLGVASWVGLAIGLTVRETLGDRYFRRPSAERAALKARVQRRARRLAPVVAAFARVFHLRSPETELAGVKVPALACPLAAMRFAAEYRPDGRDIFVATQMKCGTTWMQQVVYEVLSRGEGDLGDDGHRHMYAVSPWIEARASVSMEDAPRIGPGGHRIVKTHLPTRLCPYSEEARYIYVVRNPAACFASCVDFIRMLTGPFAFTLPEFVDWFCSDDMHWRSWPEHVEGWWRWAQERPNVLFVHYEEMLENLDETVGDVAAFLGVELTPAERARVVEKSSFAYMKEHEDVFEMAAPTPFSVGAGSFLRSGSADRDRDVGPADRARIAAFCRERLAGASYPLERFYPEIARVALPEDGLEAQRA
jgi:hypothetical protein